MSESQKKEAKRLVEILKATGFLKEGLRDGHTLATKTLRCEAREEVWIQEFTEAIAIYKAEELEAIYKAEELEAMFLKRR